jgi:Tfp pilus assembly protein PilF
MAYELEQAAMLRSDFLAARFNLGVVYKRAGEYEKARQELQEVLKLNPNSADAWMQIGATYEEQGFFDDAQDAYKKARDLDYTNPDIQTVMADLEERKQVYHEKESMRNAYSSQMLSAANNANLFGQPAGNSYRNQQNNSSAQAIPYLTSMLAQQFMSKIRGRGHDED